ncbi:MAG: SGNH/GDSL hydrolase family protein [Clostridia bacterium]|nr:SGNH/GDSL hydrolase family protein [Clostridia bacterium]
MNLTFDKMKELVIGAVRTEETENGLQFFRFTEKQQELYRVTSENFYKKTFATAGVRLSFCTDSEKLGLKMFFEAASSRRYFSVDVFADGKMIGCMDNFTEADLPQDYTKVDGECGVVDQDFELGTGVKTVCIYLPWSALVFLQELRLDEGAFAEAVKPAKKLLAYGDSITQGYDALRPSNRYVAKLADLLGAEELNKGIGGEKFFRPWLP